MKILFTHLLFILSLSLSFAQHQSLKKVDVNTLKEVPTDIAASKRVISILFNGDATKLFLGSTDLTLAAYDLQTDGELWSKHGTEYDPIAAVGIPGSDFFITAQNKHTSGKIKMLSWNVGQDAGTLSPYGGGRTGIDFFNGKLAWAGPEAKVFEYDITTNAFVTSTGWPTNRGIINTLTYGPYGNIFTGGSDGVVYQVNKEGDPVEITYFNKPVLCVAASFYIKGPAYGENPTKIAAGDGSGALKVKDIQHGTFVYEDTLANDCRVISFHPTDPDLLIVATRSNLHFIDLKAGKEIKKIVFTEEIWSMDVATDGSKIVLGMDSGNVKLFSFE